MPHYVYIVTTNRHQEKPMLLPGMCRDVRKMVKVYRDMPSLYLCPAEERVTLLYLEEHKEDKAAAEASFKAITAMPRSHQEQLITQSNPDWLDVMNFI